MTGELSAPSKVLFEALREQLRIANELAANAGRQLEVERQLVEDGRKRLDELQTVLADAHCPADRRRRGRGTARHRHRAQRPPVVAQVVPASVL